MQSWTRPSRGCFSPLSLSLPSLSQEYQGSSVLGQFVTRFMLRETSSQLLSLQRSLQCAMEAVEEQSSPAPSVLHPHPQIPQVSGWCWKYRPVWVAAVTLRTAFTTLSIMLMWNLPLEALGLFTLGLFGWISSFGLLRFFFVGLCFLISRLVQFLARESKTN